MSVHDPGASASLSVSTLDDGDVVSQRTENEEVPGAFVERDDIETETATSASMPENTIS